jgi:single-stranded DNA-binding protein
MNSCTIGGTILEKPESRYTLDGEQKVANFYLEFFYGSGDNRQAGRLKTVVWGLNAEQAEKLEPGDAVILEGRLSMNSIECPEGFKEKRAEFTANRIFTSN